MATHRVTKHVVGSMAVLMAIAALAGSVERSRTDATAAVVAANTECYWILDRIICP